MKDTAQKSLGILYKTFQDIIIFSWNIIFGNALEKTILSFTLKGLIENFLNVPCN